MDNNAQKINDNENENENYNEKRKKNLDNYSKDIINHIKEVKFREIFNLLDRDKKHYISYSNITYNDISGKIMIALTPVIDLINRNKNKKINYQEFRKLTEESLSSCMLEE